MKEYLTSDRLARSNWDVSRYHIVLEPAHTILAQACLGVLLRLDDRVEKEVGGIPLVEYAARHWFDHAQFGNVASCIRDVMECFFDANKPHWRTWCKVQMIDTVWESFWFFQESKDVFPLYYASLGGFYDVAEHLVGKHPEHINARGGWMLTPLVAALHGKHFQVAELLLRNGADVDVRDGYENTLLRVACNSGFDIVKWLLDHGADVNTQNHELWTPLHSAADHGHLQIFQMLVEHNANIHIRESRGSSPLHVATCPQVKHSQCHVDMMQILLDHGANPNALDNDNSTPLHLSSWWDGFRRGRVEGTRLLLEHGAIVDAEDNEGRTPLQLALEHGRDDIVTCLKEHGATR